MYGKCKNCARLFSCPRPRNLKFGFCETDFEPKEKAGQPKLRKGMQWKQISSTEWEAEGEDGKFRIERSRGKFWARYASNDTAFKMPPKDKLSQAKEMCENNDYWE